MIKLIYYLLEKGGSCQAEECMLMKKAASLVWAGAVENSKQGDVFVGCNRAGVGGSRPMNAHSAL